MRSEPRGVYRYLLDEAERPHQARHNGHELARIHEYVDALAASETPVVIEVSSTDNRLSEIELGVREPQEHKGPFLTGGVQPPRDFVLDQGFDLSEYQLQQLPQLLAQKPALLLTHPMI